MRPSRERYKHASGRPPSPTPGVHVREYLQTVEQQRDALLAALTKSNNALGSAVLLLRDPQYSAISSQVDEAYRNGLFVVAQVEAGR